MRNNAIDGIKAIAIIAVVFYHLAVLPNGYLGVDVFFVISGFLTARSLRKKSRLNYRNFIADRFKRILPAIAIAGLVCIIFGFFCMLPDDYENLSEQVIASNFLSENVLSAITTKNYWDVANDYKPLMHMWYIGVLSEFYIIFPLVFLITDKPKRQNTIILSLTVISLLIYILPIASDSDKFYFIQFRFFELGIGALVCMFGFSKRNKGIFYSSFSLILIILLFSLPSIPKQLSLILIVLLTAIFLISLTDDDIIVGNCILSFVGKRSFSLFVWHQILLAFYRYLYSRHFSALSYLLYFFVVLIVSEVSYRLIEKKLSHSSIKIIVILCFLSIGLSTVLSGVIYLRSGVVRDVPELEISVDDVHKGMQAEYNDRIYKYDRDFENNGKIKVLVIGNSFARDWANVLLESGIQLDLSYSFSLSDSLLNRINDADYIFIKNNYEEIPQYVFSSSAKIIGIGTKSFGDCNGVIYKNRGKSFYYDQSVEIDSIFFETNEKQKELWGEKNYIDMIAPVMNDDGRIRVFTDDYKYISQDCTHLTKAGARYYSRIIDLNDLFQGNK